MTRVTMILRRSISAFLRGYQTFTSIAVLLVFPASASLLLSQALIPSSMHLLNVISLRLRSLFNAANFPASFELFTLLDCKLTQTIFSYLFTLPFVLTFLLLAKACIIYIFRDDGQFPRRWLGIYRSVLLTHLLNSFLILSANTTTFAFLCLVFGAVDALGLSSSSSNTVILLLCAAGAVLYAIVIANTIVVCNLAIVVAAMEDSCSSGYLAVLKASLLIRGRLMTALGLALSANLGTAAVEALFQYRVVRQYYNQPRRSLSSSMVWEAFTVTYIHALLIVLEVIMTCMFYESCRTEQHFPYLEEDGHCQQRELEPEEKGSLHA